MMTLPISMRGRVLAAAAADQRADAGEQFVDVEWLGEIVVRAVIESPHAIRHGVAGGEHEHGRLFLRAQPARALPSH